MGEPRGRIRSEARTSTRALWAKPRRMARYAVVGLGALAMLFPFAWAVITSITPSDAVLSVPPDFTPEGASLDAYGRLLETLPFWRIVLNSAWIGAASTTLQLVTSAMAAYAFARLPFPGRGALFAVYLATLMMPLPVLVVPLFIEMRAFNLVDTYFALLAPTIASAFGVFLLRQAINQVPREFDEAAVLDGAGHFRIFLYVVLPLIRPALATFAIFGFMASWNSYLWPLIIIKSPEFMTLPLGLATLHGQFTTQWDVVMAGSVVSVVPILILYVFAQKHVIASVAQSGLK
ncbi:carbohydrate ABC transporter permease [Nonomuraea jiangxiensis]|uniref:Multiple sugar transport system permease protein n=1 Tax=Nonomuraea jiangxiensis TaxID=633440 RepID=A0A1G9STH1_9ACTN|nr:carbohydrate ABC transporter permease [Nonomuraea jiangxiensis]SDM38654.1 multiple sugar transport system permease protein [Nonomuraea jiangxiensis]